MWELFESEETQRLVPKLPREVRAKYEKWQDIVETGGPENLRLVRGLRDEALKGIWKGFRSSQLNLQWRVIYRVDGDEARVFVERITAHDYRR